MVSWYGPINMINAIDLQVYFAIQSHLFAIDVNYYSNLLIYGTASILLGPPGFSLPSELLLPSPAISPFFSADVFGAAG